MKHPTRVAALCGGIVVFILVSATIARWVVFEPPSLSEQAGIVIGLIVSGLIRYYGGEGCSLSFLGFVGGVIALAVTLLPVSDIRTFLAALLTTTIVFTFALLAIQMWRRAHV